MISFQIALTISVILFVLGITGVILRRNLLFMLMSVEIMLNASALAFIVTGTFWNQAESQIMYILILSVAATESSIGLALLLQLYHHYKNMNIDSVSGLHG
ncbi:MAG: NADH-quinone oxidoreductase subunit NuoK [Candidatus Dasytiphilus stammeri]